jgi:GntR family transcriptional regulator, transcriptional repressor for pyruvate dehydrogenase complex
MGASDGDDNRGAQAQPPAEGADTRFPVFAQSTLYQRIADHVRELIETEQLQPGERLPPERELAQMLGVSRVPIRESMRTLAAQGLIEIRRGQGMFVVARDMEATVDQLASVLLKQRAAFEELFAVRRLLEPAAAQWAASRRDAEDVARLERIMGEMETAGRLDPPDLDTVGDRDAQLHVQVAAAADNRVLVRIMQAIQDLHREQLETSQRYAGRVSQTLKDHRRIVDAIVDRDPVAAQEAMSDHLANAEAASLGRLEGAEGAVADPPDDERS